MEWLPAISFLGAASSLLLATASLVFRPRTLAQWLLIVGLVLLGLESLCQALSFRAVAEQQMLFWQVTRHWVIALLPAIWLAASLAYSRGDPGRHLRQWSPAILLLAVVLPLVAVVFRRELIFEARAIEPAGNWLFRIAWPGKLLQGGMLIGSVLVLANLEWTFRAAVGTARWRIKYAVIGLALLFGTRLFSSSQALLYSGTTFQWGLLNSVALSLACVLLAFSFYRSRLATVDIYPSATALYKSLTIMVAGVYLVIVGLIAKLVITLGGERAFPLLVFVLLVAAVGLSVLWLSDRFRSATKQFVSRHFQRPMYDYRRVWSSFTATTAAQLDRQELFRAVARLISTTFEALSVSVWAVDPARGTLALAASTSLTTDRPAEPFDASELLASLSPLKPEDLEPVCLERSKKPWCEILRRANPTFFPEGGERLCSPLVASGEVVGFLVVGDRVAALPFTAEELELLKCLSEQLAATLRTLRLSEQVAQARELQAFQAMSSFLVHDLKNTASTLSLMLRNMAVHYDKPAFREDALRGLGRCVEHINDLISRLTLLRGKLEIHKAACDFNDLMRTAIKNLGEPEGIRIEADHWPLPKVELDARQIESVFTNLLFNARDAITGEGVIRVRTEPLDRWAVATISDTGCGMTPEFIAQNLFRPFQTTKQRGLGIGMYQAKTIVEAHGGRIEAQSVPGAGSTFRVWLPLPADETTQT
ncbi:MAG TPA: XrtA/PEP-CTERM system histidine kinase PrsK [Verrucomicrobiae bacterium]